MSEQARSEQARSEQARARPLHVVAGALALAVVLVLAVVGVARGSGPSSSSLEGTDRVVIVSIPGLRWQDLQAVPAPHVTSLLSAAALSSVRSIGPATSLLEGYLAFGAGNRLEADRSPDLDVADARCLPDQVRLAANSADDDLNGAVPGALGTAVHAAGLTTAVFGSSVAVAGLMDDAGCVDVRGPAITAATPNFDADVTLVELAGLEVDASAAQRTEVLVSIDAALAELALPADATVVVMAPAARGDAGEVVVVGVRDLPVGATAPASLVSPSTRRADYVQLIDLAPTVLHVLGLDVPASMSGTAVAVTATADGTVDARTARFADLAERVEFRDRAVGPVSVVFVVLLVLCGVAGLARRARLARMLAPIVVAYAIVAFAMGLVAYHQLPLDFVVVAVPVVAMVLAAATVAFTSRWGGSSPVTLLVVGLWVTLMIDVIVGGPLQINTPLGYTPTVAGRFQGIGNLSFGLLGAASTVVAVVPLVFSRLGLGGRWRIAWAVWIGAITMVVVAAPAFGADVGGTLALIPAFAGLVTVLAGRRIKVGLAVLVGVCTVAVVALMAVIDRSRDASSRTHLGRFLDELLDGDGWLIIRRKLRGNLSILTSSFWSVVLVALIVAAAVVAWRRRGAVADALRDRVMVRAFLTGFAIMAVLGFALNDSGLAVPAIMLGVGVPWLVAVLVPVVQRVRR